MMTTRRGFLGSILSCATPPGFVRSGVLMPLLVPRPLTLVLAPWTLLDDQWADLILTNGAVQSLVEDAICSRIAADVDSWILRGFA